MFQFLPVNSVNKSKFVFTPQLHRLSCKVYLDSKKLQFIYPVHSPPRGPLFPLQSPWSARYRLQFILKYIFAIQRSRTCSNK